VTVGEDQGVREAARHGEGSPVTTRIAVITGVSTGLGEALARRYQSIGTRWSGARRK